VHPALVITLAAAAALPLGLWLRHDLNKLSYRTKDERDLPHPGPRWWVVWASVLAAAGIAAAAALSNNALAYVPLVPLVISGPWLAAVDFDVMRIPNRVVLPTAVLTMLALFGVAAAERNWSAIIPPVVAALVTGGLFASVHVATRGGIGLGDVKLSSLIAFAVGPLGVGTVWLSILAGSVTALVWTKVTRRIGPIPYGPWLLSGCWIAALTGAATRG
jgi:leader peptidase (prepilin peptidase)/N-methyltransferase